MPKITLEQIQEELAQDGWKVLSKEYKNLGTEMEFECSEGHKVYGTWEKLRKRRECPMCKQNVLKSNTGTIIPKKKGVNRILALDQASHKTGWAVFDGKQLVQFGVFEAGAEDEIERFYSIRQWLISMIQNWEPTVIGIEGIQYQESFGVTTFQTLARLQGILMETCYEAGIEYRLCSTNTWRAHCGVKGKVRNDKKRSMQMIVKGLYDMSVSDDESDAIGIGKYIADHFVKQTSVVEW